MECVNVMFFFNLVKLSSKIEIFFVCFLYYFSKCWQGSTSNGIFLETIWLGLKCHDCISINSHQKSDHVSSKKTIQSARNRKSL